MTNDADFHFNKLTGKTYVSPRIKGRIRIASKVLDSDDGIRFASERDEIVIRRTPSGRQEIVAKFIEDDRRIFLLTFQKWNLQNGMPVGEVHFTFRHDEVTAIIEFLLNIKKIHFPDSGKININDEKLRNILLSHDQTKELILANEELVASVAASELTSKDIVALGYRKKQLERFEKLLTDEKFFKCESESAGGGERAWQLFFEQNRWIFGFGLTQVFLSGLDGKKLEQTVLGNSIGAPGKVVDGLLRTQALISALCFVEIKRHDTSLLNSKPYRAGAWAPSSELSGGVAQIQETVHSALKNLGSRFCPTSGGGSPTGETLFNFEPKSFLVVGSLNQFIEDNGVNESKYRSFELFRRSIHTPEIITFDELFYRTKYIVEEYAEQEKGAT